VEKIVRLLSVSVSVHSVVHSKLNLQKKYEMSSKDIDGCRLG
jgi:hypothetical protein